MHDAPGPWTRENRRGRAIIIDADRNEVCEAFAAPALIAAAPELLAALRDARVMIHAMTGDAPVSAPWNALLPRVDAAIARATGADHA